MFLSRVLLFVAIALPAQANGISASAAIKGGLACALKLTASSTRSLAILAQSFREVAPPPSANAASLLQWRVQRQTYINIFVESLSDNDLNAMMQAQMDHWIRRPATPYLPGGSGVTKKEPVSTAQELFDNHRKHLAERPSLERQMTGTGSRLRDVWGQLEGALQMMTGMIRELDAQSIPPEDLRDDFIETVLANDFNSALLVEMHHRAKQSAHMAAAP